MDVREKLVELLKEIVAIQECGFGDPRPTYETVASYLMSHGVTVHEWVSVDERLPEPKENAICLNRHGAMMIGTYTEWGWMFPCYFEEPTYWMKTPQPPKGGMR